MRIVERELARRLRHRGHSYGQIMKIIPVGKANLNRWLKDIYLTRLQKDRILARIRDAGRRGSQKGAWQNRQKSLKRIRGIVKEARREFLERIEDPLFLIGIALFWAEGAKKARYFSFVNSDPNAIRTIIKWLVRCLGVPKRKVVARLYLHRTYAHKGIGGFWLKATGLPAGQFRRPVFKATQHAIRKNPSYMGCCRVDVFSSEVFWRIRGWQESLLSYLRTRAPVV